jgi:hypothetical protein
MNFPYFCLQHEKLVDGIGELETRTKNVKHLMVGGALHFYFYRRNYFLAMSVIARNIFLLVYIAPSKKKLFLIAPTYFLHVNRPKKIFLNFV